MIQPRYIEHVTLTTGHVRRSLRHEVLPETIAVIGKLIGRITSGAASEAAPIPGCPGYSVVGRAGGRCLVATIWADGPPAAVICTIGVADHPRCGAPVWRALHKYGDFPVLTDVNRQPAVPWCAAALERGIEGHIDAAGWLGDFERSLAWAWVQSTRLRGSVAR